MDSDVVEYFKLFVESHCHVSDGAWIHLDILHVAFMDFCIARKGKTAHWVNAHISHKKSNTCELAIRHGAIKRGTPACSIIAKMSLVTYP